MRKAVSIAVGLLLFAAGIAASETGPTEVLELPPKEGNPRNSEGDFVALKDGRLLFAYTHFTEGGRDNSAAFLAGRYSSDGGKTWKSDDHVVLENEARENVMSVSLERLQDGRIALIYLRKNSWDDCRPCIRFSDDETASWSDPVEIVPDSEIGYYVVNNDRLVQLSGGRLIVAASQHNDPEQGKFSGQGRIICYLSDDGGRSWRRSQSERDGTRPDGSRTTLQEPGVVELKNGRLMMFTRTNGGSQFLSFSDDRGETWTRFEPSSIISPVSPATIERIPSTGDLLMVWNDHSGIPPELKGKRTPLTAAVSSDEGRSWSPARTLFAKPSGWYCYTAMEFAGNSVLLGHCAGDREKGNGLSRTQITRVPIEWFYSRDSDR